jgi:hypothetical protein
MCQRYVDIREREGGWTASIGFPVYKGGFAVVNN